MAQPDPTPAPRRPRSTKLVLIPPSLPDRLFSGREVSLYYALQRAGQWERHHRTQLEIALFFTPAVVRVGWRASAGEWREQEMHGPHVCLIAAGLPHRCHLENDAELLVLYVERSLVRRIIKRKISGVVFAESAHHDLVVWFLASALRELCTEREPRDFWMIDGIGARLVRRLIDRINQQKSPTVPTGPALSAGDLEKVLRYMQANMKHDIHVVDLAKQTGHSVQHFSELFKNKTQLAPYHYLKEVRMMKAYQMILAGDHNLREIALAVGYTNTDHFSENFRKTFKESASVLLARARGAEKSRR
jgi:AraC-like DNA-binding protein